MHGEQTAKGQDKCQGNENDREHISGQRVLTEGEDSIFDKQYDMPNQQHKPHSTEEVYLRKLVTDRTIIDAQSIKEGCDSKKCQSQAKKMWMGKDERDKKEGGKDEGDETKE